MWTADLQKIAPLALNILDFLIYALFSLPLPLSLSFSHLIKFHQDLVYHKNNMAGTENTQQTSEISRHGSEIDKQQPEISKHGTEIDIPKSDTSGQTGKSKGEVRHIMKYEIKI